jgi:hypothetical protein
MAVSRLTLVLVLASCALLGAATPSTASSGGLKVMVAGTCAQSGLVTAIQGQPGIASVTTFDTGVATPTVSDFAAADLVVDTGDGCSGGYHDPAMYGDSLANYADHGGVVLQVAYDNWNHVGTYPTGRFASGGYPPLSLGPSDNHSTTLGQVLKPQSPIVQGLGTFVTADNTTTPLAPGATLLAMWADGRNAIAVKGRVVATSASPYDASTLPDIARLARNTAEYFNAIPSTKITKAKIDPTAHTAAFTFRAVGPFSSGFQCELKKAGAKPTFKRCPSHKKYARLQPGAYTFEVAAVGPGGPDATPAKKSFRIKP